MLQASDLAPLALSSVYVPAEIDMISPANTFSEWLLTCCLSATDCTKCTSYAGSIQSGAM